VRRHIGQLRFFCLRVRRLHLSLLRVDLRLALHRPAVEVLRALRLAVIAAQR
jgi:hypothetical protein